MSYSFPDFVEFLNFGGRPICLSADLPSFFVSHKAIGPAAASCSIAWPWQRLRAGCPTEASEGLLLSGVRSLVLALTFVMLALGRYLSNND